MTSGNQRQLGVTRIQNVGQKSGEYDHKLSAHLIVLFLYILLLIGKEIEVKLDYSQSVNQQATTGIQTTQDGGMNKTSI